LFEFENCSNFKKSENLINLSNHKCSILKFKSSDFDNFYFLKYSNYKKLTERKETKKEKCLPDAVGPGPASQVGSAD
jgi:hypothetical protein